MKTFIANSLYYLGRAIKYLAYAVAALAVVFFLVLFGWYLYTTWPRGGKELSIAVGISAALIGFCAVLDQGL